jgi:uncharacterized protein YuzE
VKVLLVFDEGTMALDETSKDEAYISKGTAVWTCAETSCGPMWYIKLNERCAPPYIRQVEVTAILDVAEDGTIAGIEVLGASNYALIPPKSVPRIKTQGTTALVEGLEEIIK